MDDSFDEGACTDPGTDSVEQFARYICRHFVSIGVTCSLPTLNSSSASGGMHCIYLSAFVISVKDVWVLVTAGHNFDALAEVVRQGGQIVSCVLLDHFGIGARFKHFPPLDFSQLQ